MTRRCNKGLHILGATNAAGGGGGGGGGGFLEGGGSAENTYGLQGVSDGDNVVAGTAGSKGSWHEFVASTPEAANGLILHLANSSVQAYILDVAVGEAASEVVIIENLAWQGKSATDSFCGAVLPVDIPAGSRISIRTQASATGVNVEVALTLISGTSSGFTTCKSLFDTATTNYLVDITSDGLTVNTKSAWIEHTAVIDADYTTAFICVTVRDTVSGVANWAFDIGVGEAASEVVIVSDLLVSNEGTTVEPFFIGPIPLTLASGDRLAVRAQSSQSSSSNRLKVAVMGFA